MSGLVTLGWASGLLIALVLLRVPLVFAVGAPGALYVWLADLPPANIIVRLTTAVDSSVLIAIPLYLMAGEFMNASGATDRLVRAAGACLSWLRGRLAYTNVVTSLIFAGMSGSALADAAAVGKVMIPAMKRQGYGAAFPAALTAAASTIGPIFPPSIPMIVYGAITGVSVGALFLGGVLPGVLVAIALIVYCAIVVRSLPLTEELHPLSAPHVAAAMKDAVLPLLTPGIILSGILFGFVTPTEAGAIAAIYALGVGVIVYRTLSFGSILHCLVRAMNGTAAVMILLAMASILGWMVTLEGVAQSLGAMFKDVNFIVVLIVINLCLLLVGMFMDSTAGMLVFVPVLAPLAVTLGIDPVQFGVMVVVNLMIGVVTPPVGFSLYVVADIAELELGVVIRAALPFLIPLFVVLLLVTFVPAITLWVPSLMLGR